MNLYINKIRQSTFFSTVHYTLLSKLWITTHTHKQHTLGKPYALLSFMHEASFPDVCPYCKQQKICHDVSFAPSDFFLINVNNIFPLVHTDDLLSERGPKKKR